MPKRKRSEDYGCRSTAKRPAPERKQQLYLLLDDWERGYSVRRLDVDAFDAGAGANDTDLPPPPPKRSWNFVSHGTKIFAMKAKEASPAIPAFDTHTMSLTICPWPSCRADYLEDHTEYLADPPPYESNAAWSWCTVNSPPPPFHTMQIACYALHPDGRTLFVSAGHSRTDKNRPCTFSFDAESLQWTHHGDWILPFAGQAYYDAELEAWVGLAGDRDSAGYLCSCDVPPVAAELTNPPPSWKLGLNKMFSKESELHRGAKLIHMGDSKFCLVESLFHEDDPTSKIELCDHCPARRCRVLHMTTFGLKYNKTGILQIMLRQAQACMMFKRPHDFTEPSMEPLAFWI
ncbi:hypothetical protein SORBI_3004G330500 [Sorghum bicolor]|uniref:Uncharacterized protein n=1 Tax=Sorghum bicolor TaxID=4558 RepID=A0A1Z5RQ73_SORBI|nr:hypothetical protein SORBI_3004G330500 [Sorghum bicolor]